MEELHISPTEKTPDIILNPKGVLKIKGRAIDESRTAYPELIMDWLGLYLSHPADSTEVVIALEYLNSFNTLILSNILKKIAEVKLQSKRLFIKWYIEEDDEDLMDRAEYISSTFNLPVEIIPTAKIKSLY
ncbi:MAG TPA: SiaC family regulatory phosphoprotein [Bacteroidales bacterium]|nr:SiaC family regulatory phosphoprotein [Bacteroidales bacterium]